jgi:hypothetical protein
MASRYSFFLNILIRSQSTVKTGGGASMGASGVTSGGASGVISRGTSGVTSGGISAAAAPYLEGGISVRFSNRAGAGCLEG